MKLLDLQEKRLTQNTIYMAFFMEGPMPTQTQLDNPDINAIMNDCLIARPYLNGQYSTGGRTIMQPVNRTTSEKNWPLCSAWQEVDTVYGKQVIPKTKVRRYRDLNVDNSDPCMQIGNMFAFVSMCRITEPQIIGNLLATGTGLSTVDVDPTDATKTIIMEWDFGADVEITGWMRIAGSAGVAQNGLHNVTIQAQIGGVWVDVSGMPALSGTDGVDLNMYPITYSGGKVTARYFRCRRTNATTQVYTGGIRFFGKYVAAAPRTFGKIGHVLFMPFSRADTAITANSFGVNASCNTMLLTHRSTMDDRQIALSAYSVTDDVKQIANFDLFLPNGLDFEQGSDLYPPFFTTFPAITEMEAL